MNISEALSGHSKPEDIRCVLRSASARGALRNRLKAMLSAPNMLGSCRQWRTRFDPDRKLRAYYDARVRMEGTDGYDARPIVVTWHSDRNPNRRDGTNDLAEMEAEAHRRKVAAPFRQLTAELPEWSMHVQVSPLDAEFPQLVRLSDPRYVRDMLAASYAAGDVSSDQPRPDGYAVTSMRYLPGNCHVLRYDPMNSVKGGTVFAKLYAGDEGAHIFQLAARVGEWLAQHGDGVNLARPLAYMAEDGVVLYPRAVGTPLSDYLWYPTRRLARGLERAGAALHALHHVPQEIAGSLQFQDFVAEVKKIARVSKYISALLPSVGAAIDSLLDRSRELHQRLPQEPPTFTYGESKAEHVWVTRAGLTLIDFDTCHFADPALDIGKFLADLQFLYTAYDQPGLDAAQDRFLAGYSLGAPSERLVRARLYEAIEVVKMTARRVPLFDPHWGVRTERLIGRAWTVMNDLLLVLGLPAMHSGCGGPHELSARGSQP
jgi:aminoglycoside phosphotransferase (APT) family kinase protein